MTRKEKKAKTFAGKTFGFSSAIPGTFRVEADEKIDGMIAFNFLSPEESDLRNSVSGVWRSDKEAKGSAMAAWRDESWIFLLSALAIAALHAFVVRKQEDGL